MHAPPASTTPLPIRSDADLAWVRQQVRRAAVALGFDLVQQTKLVTAASELARNTLIHGGGGLGLGLSGAERLVQEFTLDSRPGEGTTVTITTWVSGLPAPRPGGA